MNVAIKRRNKDLFAKARERLRKTKKVSLDCIYINHSENAGMDRNFFFLTGITQGNFLYSSVIVTKDGAPHLFVQELEEEEARLTGLPYTIIEPGKDTLRKALKNHKYIGVNATRITLHEAGRLKEKRLSPVNILPELNEARASKSREEIELIRKSAQIAAVTAARIPKMVEPNMTEKELAARIEYAMVRQGSERPSFDTIVAFGENSAIPHAVPTDRKLKKGDFILCDFGATYGKLCSDITRVYVYGTAKPAQQALYKAICSINRQAIAAIKVGANAKKLHETANEAVLAFFKKVKAPGKMGHGLGHSVGLEAHDGRRVGTSEYKIPDRFVTTIEPAGYLPGFGGVRIEDMVLVTRQGVEVLTDRAPKRDLIEIN